MTGSHVAFETLNMTNSGNTFISIELLKLVLKSKVSSICHSIVHGSCNEQPSIVKLL